MGRFRSRGFAILAVAMAAFGLAAPPSAAAAESSFRVAWSIYAGWMPWGYAADSGIMKKWADRYGITVEVKRVDSYLDSINQFTDGAFDGCAMTNMDALTMPAAAGVDSTSLLVGDFSSGNDGIVLKNATRLQDIAGRRVLLVKFSVSHYLLARALESAGLGEGDVTLVDTSDADIVKAFGGSPEAQAVVTWNPQLADVQRVPGASLVFDSKQIAGEIIDMMVVNTKTLSEHPEFGKALAGAWYEVLARMRQRSAEGAAAIAAMAAASGTDVEGFRAQLRGTWMFYGADEAAFFAGNRDLVTTMDRVRKFSFDHGLLGKGAASADAVGIRFPDGTVLGNADNVKLRFSDEYMKLAADGKL